MKKLDLKQFVLLFVFSTVIAGFSAEAQKRESRRSRQAYSESHHKNNQRKNYSNDYRKGYRDSDYKANDRYSKNRGDYKKHDYAYHEHSMKYNKEYKNKHNNQHGNYAYKNDFYYRHPNYGVVYRKFHKKPVRFRHHDRNYYYYGGHYYCHKRRVGYVRVILPEHVVFNYLPEHTIRYTRHGHVYYGIEDLIFEKCRNGFRRVPDCNFHISAHF